MSKVLGTYDNFTKTTHQMWSYHVTLASNFENFYFLPNSVSNFGKSYQFGAKTNWGMENIPLPPSAYMVKHTNPLYVFHFPPRVYEIL